MGSKERANLKNLHELALSREAAQHFFAAANSARSAATGVAKLMLQVWQMSGISTHQANWLTRGREDFWFIAAVRRRGDETEIRDDGDNVRAGCEEHPPATRKHNAAEEKTVDPDGMPIDLLYQGLGTLTCEILSSPATGAVA